MWSQSIRAALTVGAGCPWLPMLLDAAVKGMVVLGLATVATLAMRRSAAAARHLVWCVALASLPVLPVVSAVAPGWHMLPQWMAPPADRADEVSSADGVAAAPAQVAVALRPLANPGGRPASTPGPVEPPVVAPTAVTAVEPVEPIPSVVAASPDPPVVAPVEVAVPVVMPVATPSELRWPVWALVLWCVGAVAVLVPVGVGMLSLGWLRRTAELVVDDTWISQLQELSAQLGIRRRPILLRSPRRWMPMHWGILRPKLLVPAAADGWTADRRRVVLLHELAHIRRRDCLAQLIARLACAAYWFNPLVWVALWRMRVESETACDDLILRSGYRGSVYAGHLLEIVAGSQPGPLTACGSIGMARRSGLEGRLRAILDGRRNRRAPTRAAAALIVALLAAVVVPVAMMRAAGERGAEAGGEESAVAPLVKQAGENEATYDHFLYLRHNPVNGSAKTTSLVLAKVTPDGFQQRDVFTHNNLQIGWEPVCVVQGTIYARHTGDLIAIDLTSGASTLVCSYVQTYAYDAGRMVAMVRAEGQSTLREFDFGNQTYRDVCRVDDEHWGPPLAISPDRKRLAYFAGRDNMMSPSSFQLRVIDLASGESKAVGPTLRSMAFITGGGSMTDGPPFLWLDDKTILLIHDEVPAGAGAGQVPLSMMMSGGPSSPPLATLDLDTGQMTDVLTLPRFTRRLLEPYLRPLGPDGVPRIVVGELGQYCVDLNDKKLIEDNTVIGPYGWSRGREPERLLFGETELFAAKSVPELAVSPDGRQVVWLTKRSGLDAEMRYHAAGEKAARVVAQGWFPTASDSHRRPEETVVLWVAAKDLVPAAPPNLPQPPAAPPKPQIEWKPFSTDPWPPLPNPNPQVDQRLHVSSSFTLSLAADKATYRQHDPVRLAITLENKTGRQLSFKSPNSFDGPIRLTRKSPQSSGMVDLLRDTAPAPPVESDGSGGTVEPGRSPEEVFAAEQVTLAPWESLRFFRLLEVSGVGQHTIGGSFRLNSEDWQGSIDAQPITFRVESSGADGPLLEAKFERLMALCRREYATDPMTCRYSRMYDLGPPAVPLLVAALEATDDAGFRQRMGFALATMATADALPYFERLLAGNMQDDQRMVLDGLSKMIERSQSAEQALDVLLSALKHDNPAVRRGAAERLRAICDPQVAAAMQTVVGDDDRPTALVAARYLAAYERLDLAGWLALAAEQPTRARYVAAGPIVEQLQQEWHQDFGQLPGNGWDALAEDPAQRTAYQKVLRSWEQWARENARSSEHFFDDDRQGWPEQRPQPAPQPASKSADARSVGQILAAAATPDIPVAEENVPGSGTPQGPVGRVTLRHERDEYFVGEPIVIDYCLRNVGTKPMPIEFGGDYRGTGRHERFKITVIDPQGKEVPDVPMQVNEMGGLMQVGQKLEPGEERVESLELHKYRRLVDPGRYTIRVVHDLGWDPKLTQPPVGETTITLALPNAEQARAVIAKCTDLGLLRNPVYLPVLKELVRPGDRKALAGIGSIHTLEATRALLELIDEGLDKDDLDLALAACDSMGDRLPNPRFFQEAYGDYYKPNRDLLERVWRPEFAEPLRRLARRLAHDPQPRAIGTISTIFEYVGKAEDMPDLILGYTKSIEATRTLPFETHQYFRPRGSAYSYRFSARELLARGAAVPTNPQTPGEAAVYLIAMQAREDFRPADWPGQVVRWLKCDTPYMRELVLDYLPEPVPEAVLDMLPELLADDYVDLQIAACHMAGKHPREALREPIRTILRTETEQYLLNAATSAGPPNGVTTDQIMEIWLDRLDNDDLGGKAVVRLLLSVLDDNQARSPNELDAEAIQTTRARWGRFIEEHREALIKGHRYKLGDPEITPDLFPPGFQFYYEGKPWPAS